MQHLDSPSDMTYGNDANKTYDHFTRCHQNMGLANHKRPCKEAS